MNLLPEKASPTRPYWAFIDEPLEFDTRGYGMASASRIFRDFTPHDFGIEEEPGDSCFWRLMDATTGKGVEPAWDGKEWV